MINSLIIVCQFLLYLHTIFVYLYVYKGMFQLIIQYNIKEILHIDSKKWDDIIPRVHTRKVVEIKYNRAKSVPFTYMYEPRPSIAPPPSVFLSPTPRGAPKGSISCAALSLDY